MNKKGCVYRQDGESRKESMQDEAIVELFFRRDEQAIKEASEKYNHYCMRISMNILDDVQDSEECVNDALLQAWRAIPPHRPERLSTFLGKLTRNIAINRYNSRHASKRAAGEYALSLDELDECISSKDGVESRIEASMLEEAISNFLRGQKADARNIFLLRYYYCCPVADISKKLNVSESKVKSVLFRTRSRLAKYLEKEGLW